MGVHARYRGGRSISDVQAVQHGLADTWMASGSVRALTWRSGKRVDANDRPGFRAAMAKTVATGAAVDWAELGMQFHGGDRSSRIARVYRHARNPVSYEGADEIQRNPVDRQSGERVRWRPAPSSSDTSAVGDGYFPPVRPARSIKVGRS